LNEITVVVEKPGLVAGMRRRGHYAEIAKMLPDLFEYVISQRARIAGPPMFVWHEKSIEEAEKADAEGSADIEVCVPIAEKIPETGEIRVYELPGGCMAKAVHKGPYQESGPVYERLLAWIEESGNRLSGPIREAYLNDPRVVGPQETLTVIYAPIG
jgi:AraC family transcriptional regulator